MAFAVGRDEPRGHGGGGRRDLPLPAGIGSRGSSAGELFAWADRILVRKLKNLLRRNEASGKGISLAESLERSRERIENLLVATQTSPGERLVKKESSFRLLSAIEELFGG